MNHRRPTTDLATSPCASAALIAPQAGLTGLRAPRLAALLTTLHAPLHRPTATLEP